MAHKVCPFLVGYLLILPLRRLLHDPEKILRPYVSDGMTVLDVGSAMGFFSLPMAEMVGPHGKVLCVDVQEKMLNTLRKRAARAGLAARIVPRRCRPDSLGLDDLTGRVDFALAFAVVHEAPDARALFSQLLPALKSGANCLLAEPKGHVSSAEFERTLSLAGEAGFRVLQGVGISKCHAAVLNKRETAEELALRQAQVRNLSA